MRTAYAVAFSGGRFLMVYNERRKGWEMPGGHVEEGETSAQAAAREFEEESGYRIEVLEVRDIGSCDVCAAVITGRTGNPCEMRSELFSELPSPLSFGREEYEDTVPWARSVVESKTVITALNDGAPMEEAPEELVVEDAEQKEEPQAEEPETEAPAEDAEQNKEIQEVCDIDGIKKDVEALDGKIDALADDIRNLGSILSDRMMSRDVLAQFDKTMKGELSDVKNSSVRSLLVKIANVRENAASLADKMRSEKETVTADDAIDAIENIGDMLEEILLINGAVRFRDEVGTPYEYPTHNKAKLVDTDDPALNKTIAEAVSSGYVLNDKILLPEKVNVYRYVGKSGEE